MTDIWQYFQNLFQQVKESSKTQPILQDPIIRSPSEIAAYERWKKLRLKQQLLQWLEMEYANFLKDGQPIDDSIVFLSKPSIKGFAIRFSELRYGVKEINHFFDYLREKVLELEDAAGCVHVLARRYPRDRGLMHADRLGDVAKYERLH